jgi:hypothetical protein
LTPIEPLPPAAAMDLREFFRNTRIARKRVRARPDRPPAGDRFSPPRYFLLLGLWPAGVLPDANGEGAAPPFLRFLSAFGFFFSLLLRI